MKCDDLFCGVNRPKSLNPDEMSDLEKKHTPVITAPDSVKMGESFEVKVELGRYLAHPNEYGHFFQWIEIWLDETAVARFDLVPKASYPEVSVKIAINHAHEGRAKLKALAFCNLHGLWENDREIKVEE